MPRWERGREDEAKEGSGGKGKKVGERVEDYEEEWRNRCGGRVREREGAG